MLETVADGNGMVVLSGEPAETACGVNESDEMVSKAHRSSSKLNFTVKKNISATQT